MYSDAMWMTMVCGFHKMKKVHFPSSAFLMRHLTCIQTINFVVILYDKQSYEWQAWLNKFASFAFI